MVKTTSKKKKFIHVSFILKLLILSLFWKVDFLKWANKANNIQNKKEKGTLSRSWERLNLMICVISEDCVVISKLNYLN